MRLLENYKHLGRKEFLARWKQGIQEMTPLQQTKAQIPNYLLIIIGDLIGIIISTINHVWWLVIVLTGSFGIIGITFLGLMQKYMMFKQIDKEVKDATIKDQDSNR